MFISERRYGEFFHTWWKYTHSRPADVTNFMPQIVYYNSYTSNYMCQIISLKILRENGPFPVQQMSASILQCPKTEAMSYGENFFQLHSVCMTFTKTAKECSEIASTFTLCRNKVEKSVVIHLSHPGMCVHIHYLTSPRGRFFCWRPARVSVFFRLWDKTRHPISNIEVMLSLA